jgi:phospholipase C
VFDLRNPEDRERFEFAAPDEYLRRREFLTRTAMAAGIGAGLATVLNPATIVAEAARLQSQVALPSPRNMPIDTFVVLMMENRSFDHYLGGLSTVAQYAGTLDGMQAGLSYTDNSGKVWNTHPLQKPGQPYDFQGCAFNDPDHSWGGGRTQADGGLCDGFMRTSGADEFCIGYYPLDPNGPVQFIQGAAQQFTVFDHFHCSLLGPTLPNREYMHAAQSYGLMDNTLPGPQNGYPDGFPDTTIFAAAKAAGVSNAYFYNDLPVSALWGSNGLTRSLDIQTYYELAAAGQLPAITYVDPAFGASVGEGPGVSGDEHPHGDVRVGQAFMADIVHAFVNSPQWNRGALFIIYDEWGGFFDHVAPPNAYPNDLRATTDINTNFAQMGFRIPAIAISPYARRGYVSHTTFGFESILAMIEYRYGLSALTPRDANATNIATAFDFTSPPNLDPGNLPAPPDVVASMACAVDPYTGPTPGLPIPYGPTQPKAPERPKPHDMELLLTTGYLDRLGFNYRPPSAETTWSQPDKMAKLIAQATS